MSLNTANIVVERIVTDLNTSFRKIVYIRTLSEINGFLTRSSLFNLFAMQY